MAQRITPKYFEIEALHRRTQRRMLYCIAFLSLVTLATLAFALLSFMRPIPVVAFDQKGRAMLFEDTVSPALKIDNLRIEYLTRQFLEDFVAINSGNVERDLRDALNTMTPRLRKVVLADQKELSKRSQYREANLISHFENLEFKIAPYDQKSDLIQLIAWGKMLYEPWSGVASKEVQRELKDHESYIFCRVLLKRVPITATAIHGLLVDHIHTQYFKNEDALRLERLKRRSS